MAFTRSVTLFSTDMPRRASTLAFALMTAWLAAFSPTSIPAQVANKTVLHHFASGPADGGSCYSGLLRGQDGALYGTTYSGGPTGGGTVFRLRPDGGDFTVVHSFPSGADSWSTLIQEKDGLLYGTTAYGGNNGGGSVFRLDPDGGHFAELYHFPLSGLEGAHPVAGLTAGGNGVFYGTTLAAGASGFGTVFRLDLAPRLNIALTAFGPQITMAGSFSQLYPLEASTDFLNWTPIDNLLFTNNMLIFIDTNALSAPKRFFRARIW